MNALTETTTEVPVWYIRPGQPLVKEELFDPDRMEALLRDQSFAAKDLRILSAYKRSRKHGNNVVVCYEFGKGCADDQIGRLYVKNNQGLQAFPFDIRNPLLERNYFDCDMENAHYNLLYQFGKNIGAKVDAIGKYCLNRAEELAKVSSNKGIAKVAFLKCAYGGTIKELNADYETRYNEDGIDPEGDLTLIKEIEKEMAIIRDVVWARNPKIQKIVKKRPNQKNSCFALVLQTEERKCLLSMERYLETQGRKVDILIHDGCEIRKLKDEADFPIELLRGAEKAILDATGYTMKLVIKPFQHDFKEPEKSTLTIDDEFAAREFVKLCGSYIQRDEDRVYYFDEEIGMWDYRETAFRRMVSKFKEKLIWIIPTPMGEIKLNYGGTTKNVKAMESWISSLLPDTKFLSRKADTSLGKFLFLDGIFDFTTGFTEGFDPEIVFTKRIDRLFPRDVDEDKVKEVNKILFIDAFAQDDGIDAGLYLRKAITMALWGDYRRKKFYIGLGESNCGKGVSAGALRQAFCEYVDEFCANELLYNPRNSQDESRKLAWLKDLAGVRLAFSNELRMDGRSADGNLIKGASSGGDNHKVRNNYENSTKMVNRATLFLFANDFTSITPNPSEDTGLQERLRYFRYKLRFVKNPTSEDERQADPAVKNKFETDEYKNALFHLIWKTYKDMKEDERKEGGDLTTPKCVLAETKEWVGSTAGSFKEAILDKYEITTNPEDMITIREIVKYITGEGVNMKISPNKIGREIRKMIKLPDGVELVHTDGTIKSYVCIKHKNA
jgi:hypothetical protein